MKTIVAINLMVFILCGIILFEENRIKEIKSLYAYSGKMSERAMVFDFLQNNRVDLLKKYTNRLIINDIYLLEEKKVLDSVVYIGYCKEWENIKDGIIELNSSLKDSIGIKKLEKACAQ